ncbi:MAG: RagB/SusD family nutrient uptake outer membrane protein [Lutibacter sp.]|nr:RagB/SusD family nutrient uptake outer membrane protein [Lutibacter sp.]
MKKLIYILLIAVAFNSCSEDDITFTPYNAVNETIVLVTPTDFNNMLTGAYSYMIKNGGAGGYGEEFLIDSEVLTDNLILKEQGRQSNKTGFEFRYVPSSTHFDYYASAYRPAHISTKILENINNIPASVDRDNIEGQARFIRALVHFDMVRIYSKIPSQSADANASFGMPYLDNSDANWRPVRGTVQETYKKIIDDLLLAEQKIGTTNLLSQGRASKAAVQGLLSRVYLYMGGAENNAKVIEWGTKAVAGINVCPRASFVSLWDDGNSNGILFKLRVDATDVSIPGVPYSQTLAGGIRSEYVAPKSVFDLYQTTDIRKAAYFSTSAFSGKIYNHIIKYNGRLTGNANIVDIKVIRVEEVYLNMAEAQYRINGGGLSHLDAVRSQRYSPFVSGNETGVALLNAILLERRLELAFEMDRFFTLKRLNLTMTRNATEGDFSDGTGTPAIPTALTLPAGDIKWQLPIPQSQIDLNKALQQNPGYN